MKKEQAHVVYLQDTHLNDKEHEKLKRMGVINLFSLYVNQDIGEELFLISSKLHYSI